MTSRLRKVAGTFEQEMDKARQGFTEITISPEEALQKLENGESIKVGQGDLAYVIKMDGDILAVDSVADGTGEDFGNLELEDVKKAVEYANKMAQPDEHDAAIAAMQSAVASFPRLTGFTIQDLKEKSGIPKEDLFDYALDYVLSTGFLSRNKQDRDKFYTSA